MKEVRIRLSDAHVEAIEAEIAAGEAGSVSELIELALERYLAGPGIPSPEEMYRLALEAEAEADATGKWYTVDEVRSFLRLPISREPSED
jgi:Arc/MetJ-type ribon-helix-helix transcriptional regulator